MPKENKKVQVINYALVAKAHTPMYLMHKWWARKPHNVVSEYISHYTKEGEIVLDPFVGSGVTAIEAIKLGRKAIGTDLDPLAIFITKNSAVRIDEAKIKDIYIQIKDNSRKIINDLYRTKCTKGHDALIIATIWDRIKDQPTDIRGKCKTCQKRFSKKPDQFDLDTIKKIGKMDIPHWYPKIAFPEGETFNQGKKEAGDSFSDLFTKRNLIALSILFNQIEKIKDEELKELMKFAFTGMVHLVSKMCPVRPSRPYSSFWAMPSYWVPPIFMESNVWILFKSRIKGRQGIIAGKVDSNNQIKEYSEAKTFDDLKKNANILLKIQNALELTKIIPKNSVDYIFTDPPYGGSIPYFELSTLWATWLKMSLDYKGEITINKYQDKDFEIYHKMLAAAFKEMFEVLKPGKYLTVTFHNKSITVWSSIIKAVILAGFDLEKIIYQPPARTSSAGLLRPYGSATGDYYIRFVKPKLIIQREQENIDEERYKRIVTEAAKKIIAERGEPTPYTFILNGIIVELKKEGALLSGTKNPDDVMKSLLGKDFVLVDVEDEKGKIVGKKWWLKDPSSVPYLEMVPLADRVETAIVEVLRRKVKISFDDAIQEIFIKFPNALTPETQNIKELLEEYASRTKDGNWMLKPQVKERESEHSEMIYYLALLGKKAGLDVWIGLREQHDAYNKTRLSHLITDKDPTWRFLPTVNLDRIKQIDVIWHDEGRIRYEFEVENTTAITEAIIRGSNIPHNEITRIIVIPEERESLLFRKMKEPAFNEQIKSYNWKFMFYKDIKELYDKCARTKKISLSDTFDKAFREPKDVRKRQSNLDTFNEKN